MNKKNQTQAGSIRKSEVTSRPGSALKVEVFRLTAEDKADLEIKGRLSDIRVYSDSEWERIKKAA